MLNLNVRFPIKINQPLSKRYTVMMPETADARMWYHQLETSALTDSSSRSDRRKEIFFLAELAEISWTDGLHQ